MTLRGHFVRPVKVPSVSRNDRLQNALIAASLTCAEVAHKTGVDEKTVQRWITKGRVPRPATRRRVAELLGKEPEVLWPKLSRRVRPGPDGEMVAMYPRRSDMPRDVFRELISRSRRRLWFGGYTSYFLWVDVPDLRGQLRQKAQMGADIRFLLGDPDSPVTRAREEYEGTPLTLRSRIEMTLAEIARTGVAADIAVRHSDKHVGWSVWIFDDQAITTLHIGPGMGHDSLTQHWRRQVDGGAFDRLPEHFDALWQAADSADLYK